MIDKLKVNDHMINGEDADEDAERLAAFSAPLTKKILRIIVEEELDDDDDVDVIARSKKEYYVYSKIFAQYSRFVATALAVDIKEKEIREITFHGVSPDVYEQAIKYLDDPLAGRKMTTEDVLKVVEFYDKYEFESGMKLCDKILSEFILGRFDFTIVCAEKAEDTLDLLVNAIATANQYNLNNATKSGVGFVNSTMDMNTASCERCASFSVDHIRQLHPFFIRHDDPDVFPVTEALGMTKEELESPLFPKYFVDWQSKQRTKKSIRFIKVSGTNTVVDGTYKREFLDDCSFYMVERVAPVGISWNGVRCHPFITTSVDTSTNNGSNSSRRQNWAIALGFPGNNGNPAREIALWECPFSSNDPFPLGEDWIAVDSSVQDKKPIVAVMFHNHA